MTVWGQQSKIGATWYKISRYVLTVIWLRQHCKLASWIVDEKLISRKWLLENFVCLSIWIDFCKKNLGFSVVFKYFQMITFLVFSYFLNAYLISSLITVLCTGTWELMYQLYFSQNIEALKSHCFSDYLLLRNSLKV